MATKLDVAKRIAGAVPVTRHASAGAFDAASTTRWGTVTAIDSDGNATIQLDGSESGDAVTLATETTPAVGDRATVIHEGGTWKVISLSKVAADAAAGRQAGTDAAEALAKVEDVESHFWYDEGVGCRISTEDGEPYGASNALWQADKLLFRTKNIRLLALTTGYDSTTQTVDPDGIGLSLYDGQGNQSSNLVAYFKGDEIALGRNSESAHVYLCGDTFNIYADTTVGQGYLVADHGVIMRVYETGSTTNLAGQLGLSYNGSVIGVTDGTLNFQSDGDATTSTLADMRLNAVNGSLIVNTPSVTLSSPGAWRSAILSTAFARPSANVSISTGGTDTKLNCATFQTTDSSAFESHDGGIRCKRAGTLRIFGSLSFRITTTDTMGTIAIYRNSSSIAYTMSGVSSGSQYGYAGINGWLQTVAAGDVIYLYTNLALAGTVSARGSWLSLEFMD
jgi:hypothetical protein